MSARHVSTTDPSKVLAYGHTRAGATTMRLVCGWCGRVQVDGPEPTSQGICPTCEAKHFGGSRIARYDVLKAWQDYGHACEDRGRAESPEDARIASTRVTRSHLRAHELLDRYVDQEVERAKQNGRGAEGDPHQPGLTPEGSRKVAGEDADV